MTDAHRLARRGWLSAMAAVWLAPHLTAAAADEAPPYALPGSHVHDVPDPVSGRPYQVWVDLPASYAPSPQPLPAVFVADAPYAFPVVRAIRNRVGQAGRNLEDFVLVGLAPPVGEAAAAARQRDYTPTQPRPRSGRDEAAVYGGAAAYLQYLQAHALPFVQRSYRIDATRQVFIGHSYGSLFGAQVLLEAPKMFSHYVLGSPSFWFDDHAIFRREAARASTSRDLPARVLMACGGFETLGPGPRHYKEDDLLRDMRQFERVLAARRYPSLTIASRVIAGEDHFTVAPIIATRGLLWALPGRGPYLSG